MYSIIRINKIKDRSQATEAMEHNLRLRTQSNIDSSRSNWNKCLFDNLGIDKTKSSSFQEKLSEKYNSLGIKEKKDNVFCLEFEMSASPEFWFKDVPGWSIEMWEKLSMENPQDRKIIKGFWKKIDPVKLNKWKKEQVAFAVEEWKNSVERIDLHLDEKSPHLHVMVNTAQKSVKTYKNRYGTTTKENYSLNAKRFNPEYLVGLQDRYALKNNIFGLTRGVKGSKRKHKKLKEYYEEQAKNTLELIMENEKFLSKNEKAKELFPKLKKQILENFNTIALLIEVLDGKELTPEEKKAIDKIESSLPKTESDPKLKK